MQYFCDINLNAAFNMRGTREQVLCKLKINGVDWKITLDAQEFGSFETAWCVIVKKAHFFYFVVGEDCFVLSGKFARRPVPTPQFTLRLVTRVDFCIDDVKKINKFFRGVETLPLKTLHGMCQSTKEMGSKIDCEFSVTQLGDVGSKTTDESFIIEIGN